MGMLENKVAIVTGGAQGIGAQIARTFVGQGADVLIADLKYEKAEELATELAKEGRRVLAQPCDVAAEADVERLVTRCTAELGRLDVMVNNAGITRDATLRKMTLQEFRIVIDVHVQGAWLGTRAAAAVMRDQGSGSIINMSSVSGKAGNIGQTNYSAAKAALVGLTKAAARELAHRNVRVNAIQPGLIRSPMTDAMRRDVFEQKAADIPMGRPGEVTDVANVALFLASDLSAYMTGTVLEVAGGRHM